MHERLHGTGNDGSGWIAERDLEQKGESIRLLRRQGPARHGARMERPRFRMSRAMQDAIARAAVEAGLTAPAWLRVVVADRLDMNDPADLQPVRAYGGGGPDAAAMHALRMQLHETGGLLTQVAKVARQDSEAARHADAEAALADVRAAIRVIAGWQAERSMP